MEEAQRKEPNVEHLVDKLGRIDSEFVRFKRGLGYGARSELWEDKALETVNLYIEAMRANLDLITPENLTDTSKVHMYNLDPVFSVLIRAMKGHNIMTPEVFKIVRKAWCHSDLPDDVDDLIRCQDDMTFVEHFEKVDLDERDNIKLLALQKRGIRDLVDEAQKRLP